MVELIRIIENYVSDNGFLVSRRRITRRNQLKENECYVWFSDIYNEIIVWCGCYVNERWWLSLEDPDVLGKLVLKLRECCSCYIKL